MSEDTNVQQEQINDVLEDFVPSVEESQTENASDTTNTEASSTNTEVEGGNGDVEEGKERQTEETSGQEQASEDTTKEKEGIEESGQAQTIHPEEKKIESKAEETDIERLIRENNELKIHLEELAGRFVNPPQKKLTEEEQRAKQFEDEKRSRQILKFIPDDKAFDEVMGKTDHFNALLTSVVNTAVERSLRLMPQVATSLVDQQVTLKNAVRDFYLDNKDLVPHKKYVGFVSDELSAQHPEWGLDQLLQETEKEVRARLKLSRPVSNQSQNTETRVQRLNNQGISTVANPGFVPSGGGGRRSVASANGNLSKQEKDIVDLIS